MTQPEPPAGLPEPLPYAALPPEDDDAPPPRPPAPRSVRMAVRLMFVNAGFALLSLISALATPREQYRATVKSLDPALTADQVELYAGQILRYHLTVSAVILLANIALALPVLRGKSWARVATWLLTGTGLILVLAGGGGQSDPVAALLTIVGVGVDVAIIVLLATKASRAFFPRAGTRPPRAPAGAS